MIVETGVEFRQSIERVRERDPRSAGVRPHSRDGPDHPLRQRRDLVHRRRSGYPWRGSTGPSPGSIRRNREGSAPVNGCGPTVLLAVDRGYGCRSQGQRGRFLRGISPKGSTRSLIAPSRLRPSCSPYCLGSRASSSPRLVRITPSRVDFIFVDSCWPLRSKSFGHITGPERAGDCLQLVGPAAPNLASRLSSGGLVTADLPVTGFGSEPQSHPL
jgi:hypothetical protein